jgi:hypothetical protein
MRDANSHIVHHSAFLSTTLDKKLAANYSTTNQGDVIAIHLPKGHTGAYVAHMSKHPDEHEFILPRNLKLKIDHSKREVIGNASAEYPIYLHHAYPVQE